ncbi:dioxygenase (plasmid) [Pseudoalteromonas xiamenensis]|uniref:dioxygenase family protein n=1 Tax=Pseudoalteromonas xiamenensis TaxID=882626 RepID=UPI0027E4D03E|nr:class III extradiol ring-cleavage dioxygenase [Pseudoalteromonas xiamenensis]WMN61690.1 dioxygenase [Pseudoalteromonas xiamenensis]
MKAANAPLIYVSHGAPTFALDNTSIAASNLKEQGKELRNVKAIIAMSPHYTTSSLTINTTQQHRIVHDFYGFAKPLYELTYEAAGHQTFAEEVARKISASNLPVTTTSQAHLDHGIWIPMRYLLPTSDVPIIQMSYPASWTLEQLEILGQCLARLRLEGYAVLMSGGVSHNFADLKTSSEPASYVNRLRESLFYYVKSKDTDGFKQYVRNNSDVKRAHPSFEHFAPFYVAYFSAHPEDHVDIFEAPIELHALAMDSITWKFVE